VSPRRAGALAVAAQLAALGLWFALAPPGRILGSLLAAHALILLALAGALAFRWRRAPFAIALSALFPFALAIGKLYAQPAARLPAGLLALAALASVLALGIASRRG
jgi:hypothetical protein